MLRTREITFAAGELRTPIVGTQALYRTTDQQGAPVTTVTMVFRPITPTSDTRMVSVHSTYDALGSQCDPSYTLQGNNPSRLSLIGQSVIAGYLTASYHVSVPDYEGQRLEWTVGRQSGYAALDGVRAAQAVLRVPSSTPVGLVGYSSLTGRGSSSQVMITRGVQALAHTYCARGVPVTYTRYDGLSHGDAYFPFQGDAALFLDRRFTGMADPATVHRSPRATLWHGCPFLQARYSREGSSSRRRGSQVPKGESQ